MEYEMVSIVHSAHSLNAFAGEMMLNNSEITDWAMELQV